MRAPGEEQSDAEKLRALALLLAAEHLLRRDLRLISRRPASQSGADLVAIDTAAHATVFVTVLAARLGDELSPAGDGAVSRPPGRAGARAAHVRFDTIRVIVDARDALVRLDHLEGAPRRRAVRGPAAGMPATGRTSCAAARRRS